MKRTKEIKVFVTKNIIEDDIGIQSVVRKEIYHGFGVRLNGQETFEATLIIELPEKSITITESEYEQITIEVRRKIISSDKLCYNDLVIHNEIKKELFNGRLK